MSSSKGFVKMLEASRALGADTMQFFVRNPRGAKAKQINEKDLTDFNEYLHKYSFGKVIVHAPYTMNVCSDKPETREFGIKVLAEDLKICEYFPGNLYNFHPGSAVGQSEEEAINFIADALNSVLYKEMNTTVLLETMSGKGTEIGRNFTQIRKIIDKVALKNKIGVCLDTCHIWDAGYDIVSSPESVFDDFDKTIGLDYLKAIHLNDSKNGLGSHKDRHELIGKGQIGIDALVRFIENPAVKNLPVTLETPTDDKGHGEEISLLREKIN